MDIHNNYGYPEMNYGYPEMNYGYPYFFSISKIYFWTSIILFWISVIHFGYPKINLRIILNSSEYWISINRFSISYNRTIDILKYNPNFGYP